MTFKGGGLCEIIGPLKENQAKSNAGNLKNDLHLST